MNILQSFSCIDIGQMNLYLDSCLTFRLKDSYKYGVLF